MEKKRISKKQVKIIEKETMEELTQKLYRYCMFLTRNKWEGEDLTQEALLKGLRKYGDGSLSSPLLKKIAYHVWVDQGRRDKKETLLPDHELEAETNDADLKNSDVFTRLFKNLTPKQMVTLVLKEAFQYRILEIAELLNMSETGVKALLYRARIRVKELSPVPPLIQMDEKLFQLILTSLADQDPSILITELPAIFPSRSPVRETGPSSPSMFLSLAA